jgi:DNA-binding MarR family transcriptional regulator
MKRLHNVATTETTRSAALERLWGLALVLSDSMQAGLVERGLTLARAALLWQLQQSGPSTQQALSRALRVTPRNITGLVDALEVDSLVARSAHPTDRRATVVALTEKGATLARALKRDQDRGAQYLFKDVTAAELATFVKVVDLVLAGVWSSLPQAGQTALTK